MEEFNHLPPPSATLRLTSRMGDSLVTTLDCFEVLLGSGACDCSTRNSASSTTGAARFANCGQLLRLTSVDLHLLHEFC